HELKQLFRKIQATVMYVTHDQVEALTLADRVVVLERGRIQQIGTPEDLYRSPRNRFVASFIGSPSMNLFEADLDRGCFQLGSEVINTGTDFSGRADIGIRPEAIRLEGRNPGKILWVENLGLQFLIGIQVGAVRLTVLASRQPTEETVNISVDAKDIHVFENRTG